MIHEVKLPRETKVYLWQIVRAQMELLSGVAALPATFSQKQLRQELTNRLPAQQADQLANWLYARKVPKEALEQFAAHNNPTEKTDLVERMRRDVVRLFWGRRQEKLECRFPVAPDTRTLPSHLKGAHDFLVYFYDGLDDGLLSELFPKNPCSFRKYGREQFFSAFERDNPGQHVCAICDEHRYMTVSRGKYSSDIEHYFPRAIYPHLSVHPYNLIPICGPCNSVHLDRDPLNNKDGSRRSLGDVFLPYRAESLATQGVVRLLWQNTNPPDKQPSLHIQPRQANDGFLQIKLQAFSEVYDIPGRWQNRIHQIGEQLWRYIRHYVRAELSGDEEIDLQQLQVELERLLSYLFEDLGRGPWTYGLIWYLSNILIEEIEVATQNPNDLKPVPLVETIRDMLRERDNHAAPYGRAAKEALALARGMYSQQRVNPLPLETTVEEQ